jgi:uncharacterized protein (DUF2147 family)
MRLFASLLLAAAPALAAIPALAATPTVLGDWQTPIDAIVRIAPCTAAHTTANAALCLTVVRVSPTAPLGPNGRPTDLQNPDPTLRSRALCGLVIGTGFHPTDPDHLTGGYLYDPNTGHTYHGTIAHEGSAPADTLHLRGYIGISLFGRTETWRRSPTVTPCQ